MENNYPPGVNDKIINEHFGSYFNQWFEEHYDDILESFYEEVFRKTGIELPDFDKWDYQTKLSWRKFVDQAWEDAPQP